MMIDAAIGRCLARVALPAAALLATCTITLAKECNGGRLRVAVDVGHSRAAPGAISATGLAEYDFNKRFADELILLSRTSKGLDLSLIETKGHALSLGERPRQAAISGADVFLSIHHDSVNAKYISQWLHEGRRRQYSDAFRGFSLFVSPPNRHSAASRALAELIGGRLVAAKFSPTLHHAEKIKGENRKLLAVDLGVYEAPFAVLRLASLPAVLFEAGVIVHREEERDLLDSNYRRKMQEAIVEALNAYCTQRQPSGQPQSGAKPIAPPFGSGLPSVTPPPETGNSRPASIP